MSARAASELNAIGGEGPRKLPCSVLLWSPAEVAAFLRFKAPAAPHNCPNSAFITITIRTSTLLGD